MLKSALGCEEMIYSSPLLFSWLIKVLCSVLGFRPLLPGDTSQIGPLLLSSCYLKAHSSSNRKSISGHILVRSHGWQKRGWIDLGISHLQRATSQLDLGVDHWIEQRMSSRVRGILPNFSSIYIYSSSITSTFPGHQHIGHCCTVRSYGIWQPSQDNRPQADTASLEVLWVANMIKAAEITGQERWSKTGDQAQRKCKETVDLQGNQPGSWLELREIAGVMPCQYALGKLNGHFRAFS